jgi:hypothetical protein
MAGTIIADKIQTENSFLTLNVGATQIATMNSSGIYSSSGTKMIGTDGSIAANVSSITANLTLTGNLNLDSTGTTGVRSPAANTLAFTTAGTEDMRITSTGIIAVGTTTPNTTNKLEVSGNVGISWAGNTFIGMKYNDGNAYKMGMQLNNVTRETLLWSQSSDSDDKITFYTGSGPTERMRITTAGYVTKPYQPAFRAAVSSSISSIADQGAIIFGNAVNNIGNCYNTSNGRFTAPISGMYQFNASFLYEGLSNGNACEASIFLNGANSGGLSFGARVKYQADYTGFNGYVSMIGSISMYLNSGDYVAIHNISGGTRSVYGSASNVWSNFSGFLIG